MRRWNPQSAFGRWIALGLLIGALAAIALPATRLIQAFSGPPQSWQVDSVLFGWVVVLLALLLIAGMLLYRTASAFTLNYELDRNGLYITWLGNRAVIPLDQVVSIDIGLRGASLPWRMLQGIGYYWGQGRIEDDRVLHLFSTQSPASSLIIYTNDAAYAISPAEREAFVQDLEQRRNLGATKPLASAVEPGRIFLYAFWNDRTVRGLLTLAFALNLLVLAILTMRYPSLGATLEMRFDAAGQAADLRPRHQVLFLPLAAFGLTLVNLVLGLMLYRRERLSARLLQGASVIVQILFGIAMVTIMR